MRSVSSLESRKLPPPTGFSQPSHPSKTSFTPLTFLGAAPLGALIDGRGIDGEDKSNEKRAVESVSTMQVAWSFKPL